MYSFIAYLGSQDTRSTDSSNFFFSSSGEELCFNNDRLLRQSTFTQNFVKTSSDNINNRGFFFFGVILILQFGLFSDQSPQPVKINSGHVVCVLSDVKMSHSNLSKVSRMVLVEIYAVVMLTTSVSAATRMLTVFTNAPMPMTDM